MFRRREEPIQPAPGAGGAEEGPGAPTTVPVARDPDLAVPPFRPAPSKEAAMNLPPKPSQPPAGMGMPPRPPVNAGVPAQGQAQAPAAAARAPLPAAATERRTMVVGKGISLQGTVTDAERLVVEGTIESQMMQAAELFISPSGVFKGEVEVDDAEIAGTFDGTLTARGNLIIRGTGRVLGVARCRKLQVEEGGQLSGRMEMLSDSAPQHSYAPSPLAIPAAEV
nr:polymer-forming cytoskeletal protein [Pseudoroseomonas rhizosphaerae]